MKGEWNRWRLAYGKHKSCYEGTFKNQLSKNQHEDHNYRVYIAGSITHSTTREVRRDAKAPNLSTPAVALLSARLAPRIPHSSVRRNTYTQTHGTTGNVRATDFLPRRTAMCICMYFVYNKCGRPRLHTFYVCVWKPTNGYKHGWPGYTHYLKGVLYT